MSKGRVKVFTEAAADIASMLIYLVMTNGKIGSSYLVAMAFNFDVHARFAEVGGHFTRYAYRRAV